MKKRYEIIYNGINEDDSNEKIIKKVINKCFVEEGLDKTNLYISITLTNPEEIKRINLKHRNIDKETDVLSFPMFEKEELQELINGNSVNEAEDILGDIVISVNRVEEQAKEYGHSFERELAYMVVHGFYHLMGYDHMVEDDKKIMRQKEENVLQKLNIVREEDDNKRTSNKNFLDSWKNAINGIIYATTTQGNFKKQLVIAVIVVIASLFFDLTKSEFLCFLFTIILIIFAEMVNTAIETVVFIYRIVSS